LAFEGVQIFVGGVGSVVRGHINALPQVRAALARHRIDVTPHFVEIAYRPDHPRFDANLAAELRARIEAQGGTFSLVPNYTTGLEARGSWGVGPLGDYQNWQVASAAAAGLLLDIGRRYDATIAYCHEAYFALTPTYATLQADAAGVDLTAVYVAHATALGHELPLPNPERLMIEAVPVQWAKITPRVRIGVISDHMAGHLVEDYGARPKTFVPAGNGVDVTDPWFRRRQPAELRDLLARYGVPLDKDLAVTFGRSVPYKRHDMLLRAAAHLPGRVHPVAMSYPEYPELAALAGELGVDATLITSFDRELMAALLQWPRTRVCALPAENEPCGLIPMEARLLARDGGALLVVANSGGLAEQVADGVDGFRHDPGDPHDLAKVIAGVLDLSEDRRAELRRNGVRRVLTDYTWPVQIVRSLAAAVPHVAAVADEVIAELIGAQNAV
jgi:glycosyltransferase involved in cell wall biosynthesis